MKVIFISKEGKRRVCEMAAIPRVGDTVPFFGYDKFGKVSNVIWFPHLIDKNLDGYDVAITLDF